MELVAEYGLPYFREALWQHCKTHKFLPSPADLDEMCQKVRDAAADKKLAMWKQCGKCSNGYVIRQTPAGTNKAVRCECWTAWKSALEAKGMATVKK